MDQGVSSESWPDLSHGCTVLLTQQFVCYADDTRVYTSLTKHVLSHVKVWEVILAKVPWGREALGAQGQSHMVPGKPQIRQPEHNRSIGGSKGDNYKHWGNS